MSRVPQLTNAHTMRAIMSAFSRLPELLTKIFERDLDAVIIELLIFSAKLIALTGTAVEKLAYHSHRGVRLTFESRRADNVDGAIEIKIIDIMVEIAHLQPCHGLAADSKHLRSRP